MGCMSNGYRVRMYNTIENWMYMLVWVCTSIKIRDYIVYFYFSIYLYDPQSKYLCVCTSTNLTAVATQSPETRNTRALINVLWFLLLLLLYWKSPRVLCGALYIHRRNVCFPGGIRLSSNLASVLVTFIHIHKHSHTHKIHIYNEQGLSDIMCENSSPVGW